MMKSVPAEELKCHNHPFHGLFSLPIMKRERKKESSCNPLWRTKAILSHIILPKYILVDHFIIDLQVTDDMLLSHTPLFSAVWIYF